MKNNLQIMAVDDPRFLGVRKGYASPLNQMWELNVPSSKCPLDGTIVPGTPALAGIEFSYFFIVEGDYPAISKALVRGLLSVLKTTKDCRINSHISWIL